MSFEDIACHVWAIDGYSDDARARATNSLYTMRADALLLDGSVEDTLDSRIAALQDLITYVRDGHALTGEGCIIYGGFRAGQAAPEHMWLEYKGKIYETMPSHGLVVDTATRARRRLTRLENMPFPDDGVASVYSVLTRAQLDFLNS